MCSVTKISQNIVVLGAGINGLVVANYLVRAGHQVTLLGRRDQIGGFKLRSCSLGVPGVCIPIV